ncbi:MAG: glycosyltransferase family 4 protein [Acidobacteriota bacterium]
MRVAFFQRIFAHYQAGLMKALTASSRHTYTFYGENRDPLSSGIEPVSEEVRRMLPYTICRTRHWGRHCAFQWRAVARALYGPDDVLILEGGLTILTNWPAMIAARLRGKRVLLYTHGWLRRESGIRKFAKNTFYRMAHALLLYSPRARAIGESYGFDPRRLFVVYNSLDDETILQYRQNLTGMMRQEFRREWLGAKSDLPMVVSVGRLNAAKEYPLLLEAAALLNKRGLAVTIMLVGEGPERPILAEQAMELGVTLVLPGARYDEQFLSRAISSASLMVIPGAAGLSVIHSLSYGTPVVVHDDDDEQGPEVEAVKEGVNGARFRRGSVDDLARAMRAVLEELPKTPEVEALCRTVVDEAYSPRRMAEVFDCAVSGMPADHPHAEAEHQGAEAAAVLGS